MNDNGLCPARQDARFHRARIAIDEGADYAHILGVEPELKPGGTR